jgi:hypothetical protein
VSSLCSTFIKSSLPLHCICESRLNLGPVIRFLAQKNMEYAQVPVMGAFSLLFSKMGGKRDKEEK